MPALPIFKGRKGRMESLAIIGDPLADLDPTEPTEPPEPTDEPSPKPVPTSPKTVVSLPAPPPPPPPPPPVAADEPEEPRSTFRRRG